MSKFIGYSNRLWKITNTFTYTGQPQQFTLQPGTYLAMCYGGLGGSLGGINGETTPRSYGGFSCGVLTLSSAETMYAYVGGNGEDVDINDLSHRPIGGWNGGGNGGLGYGVHDPVNLTSDVLEQGTINGSTGINYNDPAIDAYRMRLKDYIYMKSGTYSLTVIAPSIQSLVTFGFIYDATTKAFIRTMESAWSPIPFQFTLSSDAYVRFAFNTPEGTVLISPADVTSITIKDANPTSHPGPAGGGGTDIRLKRPEDIEADNPIFHQLPEEYTELTFIETHETVGAYINTGVTSSRNIACEIVCQLLAPPSNNTWFYGSFNGGMSGSPILGYQNNQFEGYINSGGAIQAKDVNIHTILVDANGISVDGVVKQIGNWNNITNGIPLYLFARGGSSLSPINYFRIYSCKQWDSDVLIRHFIPAKRNSDDEIGLYDIVNGVFYTNNGTQRFYGGYEQKNIASMNTRFIVAGGGGGCPRYFSTFNDTNFGTFGGGVNGGRCICPGDTSVSQKYASQTEGNAFGYGWTPLDKISSTNYGTYGAAGSGGGWYGGYTSNASGANTSCGGGGGSGYVATNVSYKPLGFDVPSEFYLTDIYMTGMQSTEPKIVICELSSVSNLSIGDKITWFQTDDSSTITLNPGSYKLKCWGGDGGVRERINNAARGGYAEGVFNITSPEDLRVCVGGSGVGTRVGSLPFIEQSLPGISNNGGGGASSYGADLNMTGAAGGGGSDIRLITQLDNTDDAVVKTLPNEYQPIEYVETTGNQFMDTGLILSNLSQIEIVVKPFAATTNDWQCLFGAAAGNSTSITNDFSIYMHRSYSSNTPYIDTHYGTYDGYVPFVYDPDTIYTIRTRYNITYLDGVAKYSITPSTFSTPYTAYIGRLHKSSGGWGTFKGTGKFYSVKIWESRTLVGYFIPCKRISDDEPGMYDLMSNTFCPNIGTDVLGVGPNITTRRFMIYEAEDSEQGLLSRVIVAGGGGGESMYLAGAGGGLSGNPRDTSAGYEAASPGPGTQTESPQSSTYPIINGGFGYGGNGAIYQSQTASVIGAGGAGGGGWYGGSGTYPNNSSDNDRGGNGGSGYVLTESSYKPVGYLITDPQYYLTDTVLTTGGNDMPIGLARVEIDVLNILNVRILCQDADGIKSFDTGLNRWVFLSETLSTDLFNQYGSLQFTTDAGLLDEYRILVYDLDDKIDHANIDIVPPPQHIRCTDLSNITIKRMSFDSEYDPSVYDVSFDVKREPRGPLAQITTDLTISKRIESYKSAKVYSATYFSN